MTRVEKKNGPSQAEAEQRASHGDGPDYEEKDGKQLIACKYFRIRKFSDSLLSSYEA